VDTDWLWLEEIVDKFYSSISDDGFGILCFPEPGDHITLTDFVNLKRSAHFVGARYNLGKILDHVIEMREGLREYEGDIHHNGLVSCRLPVDGWSLTAQV